MAVSNTSTSSLLGYQKRIQVAQPTDNWAALPTTSNGTVVTSGGYRYHTFTSSGTLTVTKSGKLEVLLVGGGGGADGKASGGGGAGQVLNKTIIIPAGSYTVTVGAGGPTTSYTLGGHSFIGTSFTDNLVVAYGGTGGVTGYTGTVNFGGACGGGGNIYEAGGRALLNDTFFGRSGGNGQYVAGTGGGGGYGAVGGNGGSGFAGAGGNGTSSFSAWGLATTTGQNISGTVWYAGGGGGGYYHEGGGSGPYGAGGNGGGGGGNTSGTANTGGAGGAGTSPGTGGSGVVIVRVAV